MPHHLLQYVTGTEIPPTVTVSASTCAIPFADRIRPLAVTTSCPARYRRRSNPVRSRDSRMTSRSITASADSRPSPMRTTGAPDAHRQMRRPLEREIGVDFRFGQRRHADLRGGLGRRAAGFREASVPIERRTPPRRHRRPERAAGRPARSAGHCPPWAAASGPPTNNVSAPPIPVSMAHPMQYITILFAFSLRSCKITGSCMSHGAFRAGASQEAACNL